MIATRAGGCVRFSGPTPTWHINSAHATAGIDLDSLTVDENGYLAFALTAPNLAVVAAIAMPDESLASRGIGCGISGGVSGCRVRFHQAGYGDLDLGDSSDYQRIRSSASNVWIAIISHVPWPTEELATP